MPKKKQYSNVHQLSKPLEAKTPTQQQYISSIEGGELIVAIGPPGTGKTYIPTVMFSGLLFRGKIGRVLISRPTIECGKGLGALPGELEDKFNPWIQGIERTMIQQLGKGFVETGIKNHKIEFLPLQFMRGRTFDNTAIIIDEAQNLTIEQAKMIVTRLGRYSKLVLCGDINQNDLKREKSGLEWLVKELRRQQVKGVDIVTFTLADCQRSKMCKRMIEMIQRAE